MSDYLNAKDGEIIEPKYCDPQYLRLTGYNQYDIDTQTLYLTNFNHLLMKLCSLYNYENLPIPQIELEIRLIMQGQCTIFFTKEYGWVTGWGSLYGISIYNHYTKWLVTQPILGEHSGTIDIDGFVIYNTPLDKSGGSIVLKRLQYYAKMITDLQVSLDMYTINSRAISGVTVKDDQSKNALVDFFKRLKAGDLSVPVVATGVLTPHTPILTNDREYFRPVDVLDCIDRLMTQFSEEFGINKIDEKAERMVVEEVNADRRYLAWNAAAMSLSRLEGFEKFNKLTNNNVKISLI